MRSDTELLKELLGAFSITMDENDLNWLFNEMVNGLRDSGYEDDVVDELIKRKKQLRIERIAEEPWPDVVTRLSQKHDKVHTDKGIKRRGKLK